MIRKAFGMMIGAVILGSFAFVGWAARPTVRISAAPTTIAAGGSSTLTWTSTNATSASINNNIGSVPVNGSMAVTPTKTTTYTITVRNSSSSATARVTITVKAAPPTVTFAANPTSIIKGQSSTLSWTTTNATSASINQNIGRVALNGSKVVKPTSTKTYTITVKGSGGTVTASATVTVTTAPPPTVTFTANPDTITQGGVATLSWTATNATSASINQNIGTVALNGSRSVTPTATTIYTITVKGNGGTATASATVTVTTATPPTVTLTANPGSIRSGQQAILSWTSTDATSAEIDNNIGSVPVNGSYSISPTQETTYTITVSGPGGTATAQTTIYITNGKKCYAYVLNSSENNVAVIDTASNTIIKTIPTNKGPIGVALTHDGTHVFVSTIDYTYCYNPIHSIDTATNKIIYSQITGGCNVGAKSLVLDDTHTRKYLYAASLSNAWDSWNYTWASAIFVYNMAQNGNIGQIKCLLIRGGEQGGMVLHPDGTRLYLSKPNEDEIICLDTAKLHRPKPPNATYEYLTDEQIATIPINNPRSLVISPDGNRLYAEGEDGIVVIDTNSDTVLNTIPSSASYYSLAIHPDGSVLYAASLSMLEAIDTKTNAIIKTLAINGYSSNMNVHPDGSRLYITSSSPKEMNVVDTANLKLIATIPLAGYYEAYGNFVGYVSESISGKVTRDDVGVADVKVTVANADGSEAASAVTDASGNYMTAVAKGTYTVTPGKFGYTFSPDHQQIIVDQSVSGCYFTATVQAPTVTISAQPTTVVMFEQTTITWSSTNATSVSLDINGVKYNGYLSVNDSLSTSISETTTFTITVTGPGGTASASVVVNFDSSTTPKVTITANPTTIKQGESSKLSWTSYFGNWAQIDNNIGSVPLDGYIIVTPAVTTTYQITVTGNSGSVTAQVTVIVVGIVPTVSISAAPATIQVGGSSTLTWASTNATSASIDNGIGSVPVSGSQVVTPAATTTYTITVSGTGGTVTASATVTVGYDTSAILTGTVTDLATSQPIADVTVNAVDASGVPKTAATDASGKYTITNLRVGSVAVSFAKSGYDPYQQTINIRTNTTFDLATQLHLTLVGATMHGLVKDGQTAQPIVGATVIATFAGGSLTSTSGSDGAYALVGIPLNTPVKITATAAGYRDVTINPTFTQNTTLIYDFVLYNTSVLATVNGKITNAKTLLPEEGVKVTHEASNISVTSAADGTFTFNDIPLGEQYFSVKKDGVVDKIYTLNIDKNPYPWDIVEPSSPGIPYPGIIRQNISGTVFDSLTGKPVPNAKVTFPELNITVTADQAGNYQLNNLLQGGCNLTAIALDHEAVKVSLAVFPDIGGERFDFFLPPTTKGLIKGTVTDAATGQPVRFAKIAVEGSGLLSASSEGDGSYTIINVPTGQYSLKAVHQEYSEVIKTNIEALDQQTTILNFALEKRPINGDLEGIVKDKSSGNPIVGAVIAVNGTSISTGTDANGFYRLENIPAGLNTLSITAPGYPATELTKGVLARKDSSTPEVAALNFTLDTGGSGQEITTTKTISASAGGEIALADDRFIVVFPPNVLSADAVVTLKLPVDGPNIAPGDSLPMDPSLGLNSIYSLTKATQMLIEPVSAGAPVPAITGGILVSGMYPQNLVSSLNLNENAVFPYFYNGGNWTLLQSSPLEHMVDTVNNLVLAALSLGETENGVPVNNTGSFVFTLGASSASTAAASLPGVQNSTNSAGLFNPNANVNVWDKETLKAITDNFPTTSIQYPNPNALPVLIFHGWQPVTLLFNNAGADPNNASGKYYPMISDLVDFTNGVYRPAFISYNTRAGIETTGNAVRVKLLGENNNLDLFTGLPAVNSDNPDNGKFPYYDTIAYSMGGLIARAFQAQSGKIHNLEMIATPNHGTFGIIYHLRYLGLLQHWAFKILASLPDFVKLVSPGTADCFKYDDRENVFTCENPSLAMLNRSGKSGPSGDLTLLAGNDSSKFSGAFLDEPNDSFVPVDSVFCRTSTPDDNEKVSLLGQGGKNRWEAVYGFNHFNVGQGFFGLKNFGQTIPRGLSDWVVTKEYSEYDTDNKFTAPTVSTTGIKNSRIKVDYNVFYEPAINGRETPRDFDRVVLVQYAVYMDKDPKDPNKEIPFYFIASDNVDSQGNLKEGKYQWLKGTTGDWGGKDRLDLRDTFTFPKIDPSIPKTKVVLTCTIVHPLKPNEMTVPLDPKGATFSVPKS